MEHVLDFTLLCLPVSVGYNVANHMIMTSVHLPVLVGYNAAHMTHAVKVLFSMSCSDSNVMCILVD